MTRNPARLLLLLLALLLGVMLVPGLRQGGAGAQGSPAVIWLVTTHSGDDLLRYDGTGAFLGVFIDKAPDTDGKLKPLKEPEFV